MSSSASGGGSCAKTFQIPVVDEYTGAGSFLGAGNLAAVKLAERQINANGGVDGYCLGYKTYDTQTSPPQAALIFRQLAASSALFILGPSQSTDAQAAFPVAKSEGITAITPGVTDGSIIANARPWVFDTNILATVSLPQGGKDFVESTGAKQVMAIVDTQDVASNTQAAVIEAAFKAAGATVKQIDITSNQVSFNSEISQVTSAKPQALFVCANPAPSAAIVNGIVASGLKTALNLCQSVLGTGFVGVVPNQVNDLYVFDGSPYANSLTTPQVTAFKKGIAALTNGQEPGIIAPNMYTAVYLVANALKRSGALTSTASLSQRRALLRDALDQTTNLPVLEGTVSIDPNAGLAKYSTGNGFFLKYEDGNFNVVKP